jgi:hypothetical protein
MTIQRIHTGPTVAAARIKANAELRRHGFRYHRPTKTWCRGGERGIFSPEMAYVNSAADGLAIIHPGRHPTIRKAG